ncbi:hypothetical protein J6590_097738 [Homalodisca vitripennis]|nr:hypothetical protein J6590_097738 [Homalodisca vitripennis]
MEENEHPRTFYTAHSVFLLHSKMLEPVDEQSDLMCKSYDPYSTVVVRTSKSSNQKPPPTAPTAS